LDDNLNIYKITKHFHRRLSVGVICWFNPNILDADFFIEGRKNSNQIRKTQIIIDNKSLNLMELGQMSAIQRLISENSVNREEFSGFELFALC